MSDTITISQSDLREILEREIRRATAVSFTSLTTPEQRVNPHFGGQKILKLVRVNAMAGCRYENALAKVGQVASEERAWGDRESSALVVKGEKHYLPVQINSTSDPTYFVRKGDGLVEVDASLVVPYLRPERAAPVMYRDFALTHIVELAIGGQRYRVAQ